MSLNLVVFCAVVAVWALGTVLSILAQPGKNGTSGGMGAFILTWMFVFTFSLAALVGWLLTLVWGGIAYLIIAMGLIIFWLWFWNR